jgi:hypothetical protein
MRIASLALILLVPCSRCVCQGTPPPVPLSGGVARPPSYINGTPPALPPAPKPKLQERVKTMMENQVEKAMSYPAVQE